MCPHRVSFIFVLVVFGTHPTVGAAEDEEQAPLNGAISGHVVDAVGNPVERAIVTINKYEGLLEPKFPEPVRTGKQGEFVLRVGFEKNAPVKLKEIWVDKSGYVRAINSRQEILQPGKKLKLDFILRMGQVLSGRVEANPKPTTKQYMLQVSGTEFSQVHLTQPGGQFEVTVPKGLYSIKVLGSNSNLEVSEVKSDTRDILIKPAPTVSTSSVVVSPQVLGDAFDKLWNTMDEYYSYFAYKKHVDWKQLGEKYRPKAVAATSVAGFVEQIREMLAELEDMHIWIEIEGKVIGTHQSPWQRNWSPQAISKSVVDLQKCGDFALVGKTLPDGFGYLVINKQSNATEASVRQTVEEIQKRQDVPGFVVDLRGGCNGGSEPLAQKLAMTFCPRESVYAKHKRRNGPSHDEFGTVNERKLPAGKQPFSKPVVCLTGQRCMSSGEGLVLMMKSLPHVTTIGMRTRGASGNPSAVTFPNLGFSVMFSRWVDMQTDGSVFEGNGISPDIEVNKDVDAYKNADPTLERALTVLRSKTGTKSQSAN